MALAIDSQEASNLAHRSTAAGPFTWSFTNTAGTALFVAVELTNSTAAPTFGAVTYNSVALTLVTGSNVSWDTSHSQIQWYYLTNAASTLATGANTVSVSYTNSGTNHAVLASAISFTGANQTTPFGTPVTHSTSGAGGTSDSVVVTGTTSGNNVLSAIGTGSAQPTATSPTVKSAGITGSTGTGGDNFAMGQQPAGGSITAAYTFTSDIDGMVAFEVLAAAAAACLHTLPMMGVGCSVGWRAALLGGAALRAGKAIEENGVITRRGLLLPRRQSLIGHNGGPPLDNE